MRSQSRRLLEVGRSRVAQGLLDAIQRADPGRFIGRLERRAFLTLRAILAPRFDPPVVARLGPLEIRVPFSHDLPIIQVLCPGYSWNLPRLARVVHEKYPGLTAIDVGANVGDSAQLIRSVSTAPILCVEGDSHYLPYLRRNVSSLASVEIEPSFVGAVSGEVKGMITTGRGTGHIVRDEKSTRSVPVRSLADIVASYPRFAMSKLLKIDTDGFEAEILFGSEEYLKQVRPVLFFEYAPCALGDRGLELFLLLRTLGYSAILVYDNVGDYLLTASLTDERLLEDIHAHYLRHDAARYADIAAFHTEDGDLVETVREGELGLFKRSIPVGGMNG